jgi:hypothetical protein
MMLGNDRGQEEGGRELWRQSRRAARQHERKKAGSMNSLGVKTMSWDFSLEPWFQMGWNKLKLNQTKAIHLST